MLPPRAYRTPNQPILKVGIDLDHTLANNDIVWRKRLQTMDCRNGAPHRSVADDEVSVTYAHFRDLCAPCFDHLIVDPETLMEHEPVAHAREEMLRGIGEGVGFHLVTARPAGTENVTLRWLAKHKFTELLANVVFAADKAPVCDELGLDLHVDDSTDVYRAITDSATCRTRVLLMDASHNRGFDVATRCTDWREVGQCIREAAACARTGLGIANSVESEPFVPRL